MSLTPGTPLQVVYDSFLSQITADDWMMEEDVSIVEQDWLALLYKAIDRFERPNIKLDINEYETDFIYALGRQEIDLLGRYMKLEWVNRSLADWRQIKQLYGNKDFSQANHLSKLIAFQESVEKDCFKAQRRYRRNYEGKLFPFELLAGRSSK